ncbi:MAG: PqqD family protein [Clostridia bacterium]|nr:PqqD family protein [Clostridia bacterium]
MKIQIKKGFVVRKVGGENIVVPIGETSKSFHGMIKLNESGGFLWNFFTTAHTEEEAVAALLAEYEVDEETASRDVATFVNVLKENKFTV